MSPHVNASGLSFMATTYNRSKSKNGLIVHIIQDIFLLKFNIYRLLSVKMDKILERNNQRQIRKICPHYQLMCLKNLLSMCVCSGYALNLTTELCEGNCRNISSTQVVCFCQAEIWLQNLALTFLPSGETPKTSDSEFQSLKLTQ